MIETCLRIPSWLWIDDGRDRGIARSAFATALPPIVRDRRTKGMMNAFCAKAYQRNRVRFEGLLLEGHLARQGLIDRDALATYLRRPGPLRDNRFYRVLSLADTELWLDAWLGGTSSCQPG
ncbi:asparagine synthase-related protein [Sphingomonas sp. 1P08PE]|uniref:asparagine synthase-related protein n=1 Tax=Sphingomonas sp. 1P08PE TaxID=554122 RepID=UPI00399F621C